MRQLLLLLFVNVALLTPSFGQKVKYKKEKIYVDKELSFDFARTMKKSLLSGKLSHYALRSTVDNSDVLVFKDTTFYYETLPHELDSRAAYNCVSLEVPVLDKKVALPRINTLNYRKAIIKNLKETSFFKEKKMTEAIYADFLKTQKMDVIENTITHIDTTNANRVVNYEKTKKKFGDLFKRKPGRVAVGDLKIWDGEKQIGYFKFSTGGSYAASYEVVNHEGITIGKVAIIKKENSANVRTLVDEKRKWMYYKKNKEGKDPTRDQKLTALAKYLVEQGYM